MAITINFRTGDYADSGLGDAFLRATALPKGELYH